MHIMWHTGQRNRYQLIIGMSHLDYESYKFTYIIVYYYILLYSIIYYDTLLNTILYYYILA